MATITKVRRTNLEILKGQNLLDIEKHLKRHDLDTMDVTDCGSTPVILSGVLDRDTYTLDRVYLDPKFGVLVDSSSADSNRTDQADDLSAETVQNILEFLQDHEDFIWQPDEDKARERCLAAYHAQGDCMGDFLGAAKAGDIIGPGVQNLTLEDLMTLYCHLKHEADGDEFFRENDACGDKGERLNLLTEKTEPLKKPVFVLHQVANNDGVNNCCVVNVYPDRAEAEAKLKEMRDTFVKGLDEEDSLESLDKGCDTLTDKENFFCYYKFDTNHLFQLEVVEAEI